MKKLILAVAAIVIVGTGVITSERAHATVGGPTYVYNVRAAASAGTEPKELMYVTHSMSGKGCPPEIFTLNRETGARKILADCDDAKHEQVFKDTLLKYPVALNRVHLPFNSIRAEVTVLGETAEDPDTYMGKRTDFRLDIFQNDIKIGTYTYAGCYPNQPHIIEGYSTPKGTLVALIVSTISDCFEGGYTGETLYSIKGATLHYDYPQVARGENEPAVADANNETGTILVTAQKKNEVLPTASTTTLASQTPTSSFLLYNIILALLVIAVLVLTVKLRSKPQVQA